MQGLVRFFGGHPLWILIRLAIVSVIVGIILAALHIEPRDIVTAIRRFFLDLYYSGFEMINAVQDYFLLGAVIVFPIWLIWRFVTVGRGGTAKSSGTKKT